MSGFLTTREVAKLLGVNEKMVYSLISEKGLPASKATGKWLFPEDMVRQWVRGRTVNALAGEGPAPAENLLVVAGSNDILLDRALSLFMSREPQMTAAFANLGSLGGIKALGRGGCHMATSHLMDRDGGDFNFAHVAEHLPDPPAVVNFCLRSQGIVLEKGNPRGVSSVADIVSKGLTVCNRAPGTGTRQLFDLELQAAGADPEKIPGYENVVPRHLDVGLEVLTGRAQAGPAIQPVAELLGLDFLPIHWERFDLLVPKSRYFDKAVQHFLALLAEDDFRALADTLPGYDLSRTGRVVFPGEG